jgi:aminobenzoyl-glutamate transport protein
MKNKYGTCLWSLVFGGLTVGIALFSWVATIYGLEPVQNMLSEEGVRWMLNHTVSNYANHPVLGNALVLLMGLGIGTHVGLFNSVVRFIQPGNRISSKEKRSLYLSVIVGLCYLVLLLCSFPFLMSVIGTFLHSPLYNGLFYILSVGIGLMGIVYGFVSNGYVHVRQVFDGLSYLISRFADCWVALFFIVQFFTVADYICLFDWFMLKKEWMDMLSLLCGCLPFIWKIW